MRKLSCILLLSVCLLQACTNETEFIPTVRLTEVYHSEDSLTQIYFNTATTGVVTGKHGIFLTTADGGETWHQVDVPDNSVWFNCISFPTPEIGFVSGTPNTLMKTTDGGITWENISGTPPFDFTSFPTASIGYCMRNNYMKKTTDGGESWDYTDYDYTAGIYNPIKMHFFSASDGFIVDDYWGKVSFTSDGGNNWTYAEELPDIGYARFYRRYEERNYWCVGNSTYYSGLFYTDDNGENIDRFASTGFNTGNYSYARSMHTIDGLHYILIGDATCALSDDGGETWEEVFDQNGRNFTLYDASVMQQDRYAGITEYSIFLLTRDN